ncbi:MAG: hypothetical protein QOE40_2004 [Actinomycetota bacterium]|nr:hypothetical protein [Actinomycetota bacterium]
MKAYRILAHLIAAEVVIQSAAITFAVFGLDKWVDGGGVLDKASLESDDLSFTGVVGFSIHAINGMMVMPFLALILLILSFFVKSLPGGVQWAAALFGLVILQVALGLFAHDVVWLGPLHGINAFALFMVALQAGRRVTPPAPVSEPRLASGVS